MQLSGGIEWSCWNPVFPRDSGYKAAGENRRARGYRCSEQRDFWQLSKITLRVNHSESGTETGSRETCYSLNVARRFTRGADMNCLRVEITITGSHLDGFTAAELWCITEDEEHFIGRVFE